MNVFDIGFSMAPLSVYNISLNVVIRNKHEQFGRKANPAIIVLN